MKSRHHPDVLLDKIYFDHFLAGSITARGMLILAWSDHIGRRPTDKETAEEFGLSKNHANHEIRKVEKTGLLKWKKSVTGLELAGRKLLQDIGLVLDMDFQEQQWVRRRFLVDVLIGTRVVIEWDGDYWHGNPKKYPSPSVDQIKCREKDLVKNTYLSRQGYRVLHFWESEVHRKPNWVKNRIRGALE